MRGVLSRFVFTTATLALIGCSQLEFGLEGDTRRDAGGFIDAANGRPNLVFVTSEKFVPILTSAEAADGHCNRLARAAGLPGTFTAWYGRGRPPNEPLRSSRGWVRMDGLAFADTNFQLKDGTVFRPVEFNENGVPVPQGTSVVTASEEGGASAFLNSCGNFNDPQAEVAAGNPHAAGPSALTGAAVPCDERFPFYCFEFGRNVIVIESP